MGDENAIIGANTTAAVAQKLPFCAVQLRMQSKLKGTAESIIHMCFHQPREFSLLMICSHVKDHWLVTFEVNPARHISTSYKKFLYKFQGINTLDRIVF